MPDLVIACQDPGKTKFRYKKRFKFIFGWIFYRKKIANLVFVGFQFYFKILSLI